MKSKNIFSLICITLLTLLVNTVSFAQDTLATAAPKVEMATKFYGEGKIYIVIAVLVIIFTGIVLYLINLDKKISKLEQEKTNF